MKPTPLLRIAALACCFLTAALPAQQPATPIYSQTLYYIKVALGKDAEFIAFTNDTFRKIAQVQANAGEIASWTFLKAVSPAGQEARADYVVSMITEGPPLEPMTPASLSAAMQKAGITMSVAEFIEKRNALASLVNTEMCRIRARAGAPKKGHYLLVNQMKVHDPVAQADFAMNTWRPLVEELVRREAMSGWMFATRMLTVGTETTNMSFTVDMFPSWKALFAPRPTQKAFEAAHPGKNYEEAMNKLPKLRDVTRRDLWVVVERVEKSA